MPELSPELMVLLTIGAAQMVAVISPGPSFLVTARTAVAQSRWEGIKIALGLSAGTVVWAGAALFGLHFLFQSVPLLFTAMKIAGAVFLIWIAWQIFVHASEPIEIETQESAPSSNSFQRGLWVQLSNPKVMVFFGSIFIAMLPDNPPLWLLFALLALVTFNEFWWYTLVALFFGAGPVRSFYLRAKPWIDRITGIFLGILGIRLLWNAWAEA
jgi:RhtB (resistance to homoserine/threonine) family protein